MVDLFKVKIDISRFFGVRNSSTVCLVLVKFVFGSIQNYKPSEIVPSEMKKNVSKHYCLVHFCIRMFRDVTVNAGKQQEIIDHFFSGFISRNEYR